MRLSLRLIKNNSSKYLSQVIHEEALVKAMQSGKVCRVGLDVSREFALVFSGAVASSGFRRRTSCSLLGIHEKNYPAFWLTDRH